MQKNKGHVTVGIQESVKKKKQQPEKVGEVQLRINLRLRVIFFMKI